MAAHVVTVSWTNTLAQNSSLTPGSILVSVTGGTLPNPLTVTAQVNAITADVLNVPEEATTDPLYVASVQLFDNSVPPVAIGSPSISTPFSVVAPTAVVLTPANVTVVVK